jgi:hypothetical protein
MGKNKTLRISKQQIEKAAGKWVAEMLFVKQDD